jgi:hypothetical protein
MHNEIQHAVLFHSDVVIRLPRADLWLEAITILLYAQYSMKVYLSMP